MKWQQLLDAFDISNSDREYIITCGKDISATYRNYIVKVVETEIVNDAGLSPLHFSDIRWFPARFISLIFDHADMERIYALTERLSLRAYDLGIRAPHIFKMIHKFQEVLTTVVLNIAQSAEHKAIAVCTLNKLVHSTLFVMMETFRKKHETILNGQYQQLEDKNKEIEIANKTLLAQATTDTLTGINNRRNFFTLGQQYLAEKDEVYALLIDLDYFKQVNDKYGHAAGDLVLREFAQTIAGLLERQDIFGRLGGEEFAILTANSNRQAIEKKAQQIRTATNALEVAYKEETIKITASIGVAKRAADETLDSLLENADNLLYSVKGSGRNNIKFRT